MQKGQDTSAIKYIQSLPQTATSTASNSETVEDFGNYTFGTVLVSTGSTAAAVITINVQRSATSDGSFSSFGASAVASVLGQLYVRSFVISSSAHFYRTQWTHLGAGSPSIGIILAAQGVRSAPIVQQANTTTYGVVANA